MRHRIVSLLPAATEIACALEFEADLVGRSHECDFPPSVMSRPVCSRSRIDVSGSSREIDDRVKQTLRDGLSLFDIDVERLNELQPTIILTQAQCEVCAVSLADVEAALAVGVSSRPRVVSLSPNCLNDVLDNIRRVAIALGEPARGERLAEQLAHRFEALSRTIHRGHVTNNDSPSRPRVACIEWLEPPMTAGNWVPELVKIAGGENLLSQPGKHSPWLEWKDLIDANPDVVVIMPCGWSMTRTRSELHWLFSREGWSELKAVRDGKVFLADGHHYFNRPGPRLLDSAQILAEILHPEVCQYGHQGVGWEPL